MSGNGGSMPRIRRISVFLRVLQTILVKLVQIHTQFVQETGGVHWLYDLKMGGASKKAHGRQIV